jgi:hypothetical protein
LPQAEDHDFPFLVSAVRPDRKASFSLLPGKRRDELRALLESATCLSGYLFARRSGKVVGRCEIGSDEVLVPPTEI